MKHLILILALSFMSFFVFSNELINSDYTQYYEYLNLTGLVESPSLVYSSYSNNNWVTPEEVHPWEDHFQFDRVIHKNNSIELILIDPEIYFSYNSALPHSLNDGAIWQGKGLNSIIRAGLSLDTKYVDVTFYPEFWFSENRAFTILPSIQEDPYGYFNGNLDYPQRFGDSALLEYSWGQTDIRFNWKTLTLGFSTENIKLGPAIQNPLILSNNASGFPHIDFGIGKTRTVIGDISTRMLLGVLKESENYNSDESDDLRLYSVWTLGYSPIFIPGLTMGGNWVINSPGGVIGTGYVFPHIYEVFGLAAEKGYDDKDQKISITFDWKFPSVGFNVYFEWAREDFFPNPRGTFLTPEHTQFITIGIKQAIPLNNKQGFLVSFELSDLIQSRDYEIGGLGAGGNYYTHHLVYHGYSNEGQILGASIGPGSDSQYLEIKYYDKWGSLKFFGRRISWDKMYLYKDTETYNNLERLRVQIDMGLGGNFLYKNLDFYSDMTFSNILNQNYIRGNDVFNFRMDLGVKYRY